MSEEEKKIREAIEVYDSFELRLGAAVKGLGSAEPELSAEMREAVAEIYAARRELYDALAVYEAARRRDEALKALNAFKDFKDPVLGPEVEPYW